MGLGKEQERFSEMMCSLYTYILSKGYAIRSKHLLRCDDCKVGHKNSLHKMSLAIDIVLSKDGKIFTDTESYTFAGEYWESIGGSWGGRFNDGGHFSKAYQGMR